MAPFGKQFMQPVRGLVTWLQTHWSTIRAARVKFAWPREAPSQSTPQTPCGRRPAFSVHPSQRSNTARRRPGRNKSAVVHVSS
jgi:hypothetical protein